MTRGLRVFSVLLAVAAVTTLLFGATAFSSVTADRSVAVSVVEDDPYIDVTDKISNGKNHQFIVNRLAEPVDVEITLRPDDDGELKVKVKEQDRKFKIVNEETTIKFDDEIGPGKSGDLVITPNGNESIPDTLEITVDASSEHVNATVDREFDEDDIEISRQTSDNNSGNSNNNSGK